LQAKQILNKLLRKVDGCGTCADNNDCVSDCNAQVNVRGMIEDLLAGL
jgi:hypothetical protein